MCHSIYVSIVSCLYSETCLKENLGIMEASFSTKRFYTPKDVDPQGRKI